MGDEELGEQGQHVVAVQPSGRQDRKAFPAELVDHDQHPKSPTVMGAFLDKVVSPDMMTPAWPKSDAGTVVQPEPATLGLFRWHLQPFLPPDPCHTLGIHMPALSAQQGCNPAIAVTAKLTSKINDGLGERCFIVGHLGNMSLG